MIVFRPLDVWPAELLDDDQRETARFSAPWSDTLDLLDREVRLIAENPKADPVIVVEVDLAAKHFTQDDRIRANAPIPSTPAVIVSFESKHGPLRYATDRFKRGTVWRHGARYDSDGWQNNVRAIALSLQYLRGVDRYGVGSRGEQYRGWNALGSGTAVESEATYSRAELARFIGTAAGWEEPPDPDDPAEVLRAFRQAARAHHPDHGGRPQMMAYLNHAREALGVTDAR